MAYRAMYLPVACGARRLSRYGTRIDSAKWSSGLPDRKANPDLNYDSERRTDPKTNSGVVIGVNRRASAA